MTKTSSKGRKQCLYMQIVKKYKITHTIVGWVVQFAVKNVP